MKIFSIILAAFSFIMISCSSNSGGGGGGGGNNSFVPGKGQNKGNAGGNQGQNQGQNDQQNQPKGVSCSVSQGLICGDFNGANWTTNSMIQACAQYRGVINQNNCNTQNIILECYMNGGTADEVLIKYYLPTKKELAEQDCAQAGGQVK